MPFLRFVYGFNVSLPIKLMKSFIHVCGLEAALLASDPVFSKQNDRLAFYDRTTKEH